MRRLRPNTFVAQICPGKLQVGTTPPHMVVFSDLTVAEADWVQSLLPSAKRQYRNGGGRKPSKASPLSRRQEEMLVMMDAVGLLEDHSSPLAALKVQILGLDKVGIQIASLLAAEGVGTLELRDRRRVDQSVEWFFPGADLGSMRQAALKERLRRHHRALRVGGTARPDLSVVCSPNAWDHGTLGRLLSQDTPHLPIVERDREIQVGPLVVPGKSGCAVCADFTMVDSFPLWAQSSLALRKAPAQDPPAYLAATAAGLAVSLIICGLTGAAPLGASRPSGMGGASHSFTVSPSGVRTNEWFPHPQCGCHPDTLPMAASAA